MRYGSDCMKTFCFTIDDNIRFLKEITECGYASIFKHPYLAMLRRLHERFDLKVQLNLFCCMDGFDLSQMPATYRREWAENASWLKLSFHSKMENVKPYQNAGYEEVFSDCKAVQDQILRFAGVASLSDSTTIHYCITTADGIRALADNGVKGLLGLYSDTNSYGMNESEAAILRRGEVVHRDGITFGPIDIVLNRFSQDEILRQLAELQHRQRIWVMIHEQYFYPDYRAYQPDFEEKLMNTFAFLLDHGFASVFYLP